MLQRVTEWALYQVASRWTAPSATRIDADVVPGSVEHGLWYARKQFVQRVRNGVPFDPTGKVILEIGCGPGGIVGYLASVGAERVVGVDLNEVQLGHAELFRAEIEAGRGPLPITFLVASATDLPFADASFDVVYADNAFEHFEDPVAVLREAHRVLRPGGELVAPVFSSIWSKYGLHLKQGLKVPWANLLFSEEAILRVLQRLAQDDPRLYVMYPGLGSDPHRVRDVRRHRDLNDITYAAFREMAEASGFEVVSLEPFAIGPGRLLKRVPGLKRTRVVDVLSVGASALLRKPATP